MVGSYHTPTFGTWEDEVRARSALRALYHAQSIYRRNCKGYAHSMDALIEKGELERELTEYGCLDDSDLKSWVGRRTVYRNYEIILIHPTKRKPDKWKHGAAAVPIFAGENLEIYVNQYYKVWEREYSNGKLLPPGGQDAVKADGWHYNRP